MPTLTGTWKVNTAKHDCPIIHDSERELGSFLFAGTVVIFSDTQHDTT
jgi:hypothetical protein